MKGCVLGEEANQLNCRAFQIKAAGTAKELGWASRLQAVLSITFSFISQKNYIFFRRRICIRNILGKRPVRCTGRENMQIKKTENHLPSILLLNFFSLAKM
jgi:hypothetical protein